MSRSERLALAAILTVAAALRVWWVLVAAREPVGFHDPFFYRVLADRIAHGDGYTIPDDGPTAYYPIGYPAALGAAYWLLDRLGAEGWRTEAAAGINLVCGLAAVALVWWIGRRLAGAVAGLVAAGIVAVYPNLVFHTATTLSETLCIALLLGAVALLVDAKPRTAGLALGAAALVRPVVLPLLVLLPLVWRPALGAWRPALARAGLVALCAAAVIAPWTVRNALRMDAFVPISTNTGDNLCMSRQPGARGGFLLVDHCFAGPDLDGVRRPLYEIRRDAQGRRLALEFVRDHPAREVRLWFSRLRVTFANGSDGIQAAESYGSDRFLGDGTRRLLDRAGTWSLWLVTAGAVLAVPASLRGRRPERLVVLAAAVAIVANVVVFFGDPRFHVPAIPFMALLVGVAVADRRAPAGEARPGP